MNVYQTALEKLLYHASLHLYSKNSKGSPTFFEFQGIYSQDCDFRHHLLKYSESRFGKAFIICRICTDCGYGIGECFPPRPTAKVKVIA